MVKKEVAKKTEPKKSVKKEDHKTEEVKSEVKTESKIHHDANKTAVHKIKDKKTTEHKQSVPAHKSEIAKTTEKLSNPSEIRRLREKKKIVAKNKIVQVKAKRKTAVARAVIKSGRGRVTINKVPYVNYPNKYLMHMLQEPIALLESYNKELPAKVDVTVNVYGGGQTTQVAAVRSCIAKSFYKYFEDPKLKEIFDNYDGGLLVDDIRRKEPKKQLGPGARAKKQRSKR